MIFARSVLFCLLVMTGVVSATAFAETPTPQKEVPAPALAETNQTADKASSSEATTLEEIPADIMSQAEDSNDPVPETSSLDSYEDEVYNSMTFKKLYNLAWSEAAFTTKNTDAVDTYLRVMECKLYKKYKNDEFEWKKIRTATSSYLQAYTGDAPKKYEFIQPLNLAQYDFNLGGFPIVDKKSYAGIYNLEFARFDTPENECGAIRLSDDYPRAAIIRLNSPLSLEFIRVPEEVAKEYVNYLEANFKGGAANRNAYIRYRIEIEGFLKLNRSKGISAGYFMFTGDLKRIDVYADKDMMLPLYTQEF